MGRILMPTLEEDAAITAAAETDPDNPPLTDEELAWMRRGSPADSTNLGAAALLRDAIADLERSVGDDERAEAGIVKLRAALAELESDAAHAAE
jgi:hypothetical protein